MKATFLVVITLAVLAFMVFDRNAVVSDAVVLEKNTVSEIREKNDNKSTKKNITPSESMEKMLNSYNNKLHKNESIAEMLNLMDKISDEEKKQNIYDEIVLEINMAREESHISNLEAMTIHLAALKHRYGGEQFDTHAERIKQQYAHDADLGWDHYQKNRDKDFLNYKKMESELLARVKTMEEFPGGLTKMEYIEQEISRIKGEAYTMEVN